MRFFSLLLVCLVLKISVLAEERPNILLIFADDLGYGDLGCYGYPHARTPHLDQLAKEGTRFMQAHVTGMTCNPSRTGLFTGKHPASFSHKTADFGFRDRVTIMELLNEAGYYTGHVGKWHIGPDPKPGTYGLDWIPKKGQERNESRQDDDGKDMPIFDEAIKFLESVSGEEPFYLNVCGTISHFAVNPAPHFAERFADVEVDEEALPDGLKRKFAQVRELDADPHERIKNYLGEISSLDDDVGRLLTRLDELGFAENTLVVFSSDHGPAPVFIEGSEGGKRDNRSPGRIEFARNMLGSPGPFRGGKHTFLEGGSRVPFIVRWPGQVPAETVNKRAIISTMDWLPTLAAIGEVETIPDDLDGEDVSDLWKGAERKRETDLFWRKSATTDPGVIRRGAWKYWAKLPETGEAALFHLPTDSLEQTNRLDDEPKVAKRLSRELRDWIATLPDEYLTAKPKDRRKKG